tara:strand:- start:244 stop:990 length:747 start_codon:yes stop_codon:yes gene_type:complete
MKLHKFKKFIKDNEDVLQCNIDNKVAYLKFDKKYLQFCQENYDGFLLFILLIAMKNNKDIIIDGSISYKLYHNLVNNVMYIIQCVLPEFHIIKITCNSFDNNKYNPKGISCGLSCDVDSLSCVEDRYFKECGNLKLTHVTNFYLGACVKRATHDNRIEKIKKYGSNKNLELMLINTNFTEINNLSHHYYHTLKNLCVPLFFQKLFKHYFYASCFISKAISNAISNATSNSTCSKVIWYAYKKNWSIIN